MCYNKSCPYSTGSRENWTWAKEPHPLIFLLHTVNRGAFTYQIRFKQIKPELLLQPLCSDYWFAYSSLRLVMFKGLIHPDEKLTGIPSETLPADEKLSFSNVGISFSLNSKEAAFSLYLFLAFMTPLLGCTRRRMPKLNKGAAAK